MREMLVFIYVRVHLGAAWLCGDDGVVPRIPREQVRAHTWATRPGRPRETSLAAFSRRLPENIAASALQETLLSST